MGIIAPRAFKQYVSLSLHSDQLHLMRYILILEDRTVDVVVDDQTGHFTSFEIRLGSKDKQQVLLKHWERDTQVDRWCAYTLPTHEIPVSHFARLLTTYN